MTMCSFILALFALGCGARSIDGRPLAVLTPNELKSLGESAQGPTAFVDSEGFVSGAEHTAAFEKYLEKHPFDCPDLSHVYHRGRFYALIYTTLRHCSALDYLYMTVPGDEGVDPVMVGEENMMLGSQLLKGVVDAERAAHRTSFFSPASLVYLAIYVAVHVLACLTAPARK